MKVPTELQVGFVVEKVDGDRVHVIVIVMHEGEVVAHRNHEMDVGDVALLGFAEADGVPVQFAKA